MDRSNHERTMRRRCDGCLRVLARALALACALTTGPLQAQNLCGGVDYPFPYTDVASVGAAFCPGIMEAYVTGVSKGTTPTTFSPEESVIRSEMTTFLQRSLDQGLTRASPRAALNQTSVPQNAGSLQTISISAQSNLCAADGKDIWTSTGTANEVVQVRANTGAVLGTWTGAGKSEGVLVAAGKVFVTGMFSPGRLFVIDPTQAPGAVTLASAALGNRPYGIAFDGANIWTANPGTTAGSVSIITPQAPYTVSTVTTGFDIPVGILYDGAHIWVTDYGANTLLELDAGGSIQQTVNVGTSPYFPGFDGANIWVPNSLDNSITVVQAATGTVVATIAADALNQLDLPTAVAFDGERMLVTNQGNQTLTVFKAADLSFIVNVAITGLAPYGACSDGINFWIPAQGYLLRF